MRTLTLRIQASQNQRYSKGGGFLNTYELGAVEVTAPKQVDYNPATTEIKSKDFKDTNSDNVAEALRMTPGVLYENTRGLTALPRIKVRGYWAETGFYLDGIPMMNIYDRTDSDLQPFTTQGIQSVQVSKGFISPVYGLNSMGGAINMVTAKPQKELELSVRQRLYLGVDTSPGEVQQGVRIGTNQGKYYLSIDATNTDRNAYPLPSEYKGTVVQPNGAKVNSMYKNQTVKLKVGFVPNENHEYSLNYILSKTKRDGMMPDIGGPDFYHPINDRHTAYLLGDSFFTPSLSLNTRLYYDNFAYDREMQGCIDFDGTRSESAETGLQNKNQCKMNRSYKDRDDALGVILTLSYDIMQGSNVKFGTNLRLDHHERKLRDTGVETADIRELTSSIFAQYAQKLSVFRVVLAGSYNRLDNFNAFYLNNNKVGAIANTSGTPRNEETEMRGGFSLQGALYYDISENQVAHLSAGKKLNMPGINTRYDDTFSGYVQNPDLQPESVISYELGYDLNLNQTQVSAAVFYDDKYDMIISVNTACNDGTTATCNKYVNEDKGYIYGAEIGVTQSFFEDDLLVIGANYSYLRQEIPRTTTTYPEHMFNAKIAVKPIKGLEIIGSTMLQSVQYGYQSGNGTYTDSSVTPAKTYTVHIGDYVASNNYFTIDLGANYEVAKGLTINAGVTNLTDRENYVRWNRQPFYGRIIFPGRRYFVGVEYNY